MQFLLSRSENLKKTGIKYCYELETKKRLNAWQYHATF